MRDAICRPVCFIAYEGTLSWRSGDDVIESGFETVPPAREAGRRYRTAISTELPDGLPRILREADAKLRAVRAAGQRDAGGLVIAADASHARRVSALLREATGRPPLLVLHTEARGAAKLAAFTRSRDPPTAAGATPPPSSAAPSCAASATGLSPRFAAVTDRATATSTPG